VETHRVQPGDTFASLAQNYYGSEKFTRFLMESNSEIRDANRLAVGAVIKIPPAPSEPFATEPKHATTASTVERTAGGARSYKVQAGDTLYGISKTVLGDSNRWRELLMLNKDSLGGDASSLQIGQLLKLPEK